jgi:glycosyltransferase involved in cell wall biosynthesis
VVIEAAACGLPAMASAIYGLTDAVEDGKSGCLHPAGDVASVALLLKRFSCDAAMRASMGAYARQRAISDFSTEVVVAEQVVFIGSLLGSPASQQGRMEC